jgi:hypothetical protein
MREVLFDFDNQVGIRQANAVALGGTVEISVNAARDLQSHLPFS